MHGYLLMEAASVAAFGGGDPEAPSDRIGFLDFLRELDAEEPAIPRFWNVTVVGLEVVLFASGPRASAVAWEIQKRLRAAAGMLERKLATVRVVLRGELKRGEDLWCEYRKSRLPVGIIFGSPPPLTGPGGVRYYHASFNLTDGG